MAYFSAADNVWHSMRGYQKSVLLKGGAELGVEGSVIQLIKIAPHTQVAAHYHENTLEVFHITGGAGLMTINNTHYQLGVGDTLTCEPKMVHSANNPYDSAFEYIVFKTHWVDGDCVWL